MGVATKYESDYYGWTLEQLELLRSGKLAEIDVENLIEELESMGASERRELINWLAVLMAHRLKWQFQSALRGNSWRNAIDVQRFDVKESLEENPNLITNLNERMAKSYLKSLLLAVRETGPNRQTFPPCCPFKAEQLLSGLYEISRGYHKM